MTAARSPANFLRHVGLDRPEARAWALYDWANSAFVTTIIASVFPIYFSSVAAADLPPAVATAWFALTTTMALVIVAVITPGLGALADHAGIKKRMLALCMGLGVLATLGMAGIRRGDWRLAATLFGLGNIGVSSSFVFYDALLPHIATTAEELDLISTSGYALGYLGGGVLLAVNLAWIARPQLFGLADAGAAARLSFFSVAVWWLAFSLPLFRRIAEPRAWAQDAEQRDAQPPTKPPWRPVQTFRELRHYKQAFLFLLAFLIYNDAIGTIIRMAAIYGTEIGLPRDALISAILLVQFAGVPFALLFGRLAVGVGIKPAICLALAVYLLISGIAYAMRTTLHFYALALLVATVQGGSQALSRSLFARLIPRFRSAQFFAFFSVSEKFGDILGPAIFAGITALTGSSRNAVLSLVPFFIIGGWLVARVNVTEGQRVAQEAERRALASPT